MLRIRISNHKVNGKGNACALSTGTVLRNA
jgi:hypothetical protein